MRERIFPHRSVTLCSLLFVATAGCGVSQTPGNLTGARLKQLLPQEGEVRGVDQAGEVRYFAGEQLIDYIDGGAELYFAYNFQEMVAREYRMPDGSRATIEIYRMDRPENAYGVYSFDTHGSQADVGQDATYAAGLLKFWKGTFFVRILADRAGVETERHLILIGRRIANKVAEEGNKPGILKYAPGSGIVPESMQFFHKQICLNNVYYIADDNVLHLDEKTNALSYLLRVGDASVRVILVQYPDNGIGWAAFRDFLGAYLETDSVGEDEEPIVVQQIEDGTFCGVKRAGNFLALAFEAPDRETCERTLEIACGNIERASSREEAE